MDKALDFSLLDGLAEQVAPLLLGSELARDIDGQRMRGRIVEVEAYDQRDAASHSYKGQTPRTAVMFGPSGFLYVYFTYGMHFCMNIVTGRAGMGSAVLIRAVEPLEGSQLMAQHRHGRDGVQLTNGPAKTCQAFAIDTGMNGHDMREEPFRLIINQPLPQAMIVQTTRIGISMAKDVPWRFYVKDNPYVSKT